MYVCTITRGGRPSRCLDDRCGCPSIRTARGTFEECVHLPAGHRQIYPSRSGTPEPDLHTDCGRIYTEPRPDSLPSGPPDDAERAESAAKSGQELAGRGGELRRRRNVHALDLQHSAPPSATRENSVHPGYGVGRLVCEGRGPVRRAYERFLALVAPPGGQEGS